MKFSTEKKPILAALIQANSVVERRNTIPILGNLLLCLSGNKLTITSTDLDIEVKIDVEVNGEEDGTTTVSAHLLLGIVKKMSEGVLAEFSTKANGDINFHSGRSVFNLATLPHEDYPVASEKTFENSFTITGEEMYSILYSTIFAVSKEETRYYLNGVYFHKVDDKIRGVATDGHRLALCDVVKDVEDFDSVIIPTKAVNQILSLCTNEELTVSTTPSQIKVSAEGVTLISKVVDGTFPNYTRVIPQNNTINIEVNSKDISNASSRVTLVSTERTSAVAINLSKDKIELSLKTQENFASEEINIEYDGPELRIGVNSKYLSEVMGRLSGTVKIFFNDNSTPMIIKEAANENTLYLIMPMRI